MKEPSPNGVHRESVNAFRIISHRCLGFGEAENSLAALQKALVSGVDEVEIDVHLTRDRRFAACHYPVYRDAHGIPRLITRQSLASAVAHGRMSLETALDVFAATAKASLRIELKMPGEEKQLLNRGKQVLRIIGRHT